MIINGYTNGFYWVKVKTDKIDPATGKKLVGTSIIRIEKNEVFMIGTGQVLSVTEFFHNPKWQFITIYSPILEPKSIKR